MLDTILKARKANRLDELSTLKSSGHMTDEQKAEYNELIGESKFTYVNGRGTGCRATDYINEWPNNDKPCVKCGSTDRYKPRHNRNLGQCRQCFGKIRHRYELKNPRNGRRYKTRNRPTADMYMKAYSLGYNSEPDAANPYEGIEPGLAAAWADAAANRRTIQEIKE